jgi:hypothetical protein
MKNTSLPLCLHIAGRSTNLDFINIVPIYHDPGVKHKVITLKIGNWENRLAYKSAKLINKDIQNQ